MDRLVVMSNLISYCMMISYNSERCKVSEL
jgi:hypothetical protein